MTKTVLTAARRLSEIRSEAIHFLQNQQMDDAMIEVDYLLEHVTGLPHQSIPIHLENEIPELTDLRFQQFLQKRSQRIPLAYLLEEQPFDQYSFYVTPSVLIPRPETEHLVRRVRERLNDIPQAAVLHA
jgi:release factor glutamine methyltransferase